MSFVAEQFPALGKIDAGATVQALEAAKPEGIFNATFAGDLINFVRQGNTRGLFEGREVVSMLTGEPEYLDPLGAEAPKGWIVTGYPHAEINTPEHKAFYDAYKAKFNDYPRLGSVVGYDTMNAIAAALDQGRRHRQREAGGGHARIEVLQPVRPRGVPRHRSSVDARAPTSAGSTSRTARA